MKSMRNLINLVEDFSSYRAPTSTATLRVRHNAKVLQSDIKYLEAPPSIKARLASSIATVVEYLDEL